MATARVLSCAGSFRPGPLRSLSMVWYSLNMDARSDDMLRALAARFRPSTASDLVDPDLALARLEDRRQAIREASRLVSRYDAAGQIPRNVVRGALAGWTDPWAESPSPAEPWAARVAVLSGPVGGGKSSLAARWALRVDRRGWGWGWVDTWRLDAGRWADAADLAARAIAEQGRLVLDEVGAESGPSQDRVVQIIVARADRGAETLITTNLDESGLRAAVGHRVMDRLGDMLRIETASRRTGPGSDRWVRGMDRVDALVERARRLVSAAAELRRQAETGVVSRSAFEAFEGLTQGRGLATAEGGA